MSHRVPPDHDPELRDALALDATAQRSLLTSMLGAPNVGDVAASATFTHIGVKTRRTPGGALSCRPIPFPADLILQPDSPELAFCIDNYKVRNGQPRQADAIQELEETIAALTPKRGIVRLPFSRPSTWTLPTIRSVIDTMIAHIPASPSDLTEHRVDVYAPTDWNPYIRILVSRYNSECKRPADHPFHAEVQLSPRALNVLAAWPCSRSYPDRPWRGPLEDLDEWIRQEDAALAAERDAAHEPTPSTAADDDYDDLDVIEKVARNTLHRARTTQQAESVEDMFCGIRTSLVRLGHELKTIADYIIKIDAKRKDGDNV